MRPITIVLTLGADLVTARAASAPLVGMSLGLKTGRVAGQAGRLRRLRRAAFRSAILVPLLALVPKAWAQDSDARGNAERGVALVQAKGCGSCHEVPGVAGAVGLVGPPLNRIGRRIYIAGVLRNTPENMMLWIRSPQRVVPGNAMPDMGITPEEARDITAFLYTLR